MFMVQVSFRVEILFYPALPVSWRKLDWFGIEEVDQSDLNRWWLYFYLDAIWLNQIFQFSYPDVVEQIAGKGFSQLIEQRYY